MLDMKIRKLQDNDYLGVIKVIMQNQEFSSEESAGNYLNYRINGYYHDFMVLESNENEIMGIVYSYDFRMNDLNSKIGIMMCLEISEAVALQSVRLLVDYFFKEYPLNKLIYKSELSDTNINIFMKSGFIVEAVLKEYKYMNGKYEDEVIMTIGRKQL